MADEDDGVLTDDDVVLPPMEVRVPKDWQSKISARALTDAEPMADGELLGLCASALERKVGELVSHSADHTLTLPLVVWDDLISTHGSHKEAEKALASVIAGVESHWATHVTIEVFGELCGMLKADYSEVLVCRILSLFRPGEAGEQALVNAEELGDAMTSEWGSALALSGVLVSKCGSECGSASGARARSARRACACARALVLRTTHPS